MQAALERAERVPAAILESAEFLVLRALLLRRLGRLSEAEELFRRVAALDPLDEGSLRYLEETLALQERYAAAAEVVETLRRRNPDSPDLDLSAATVRFAQDADLTQYLRDYAQGAERYPEASRWRELANLAVAQGDFARVVELAGPHIEEDLRGSFSGTQFPVALWLVRAQALLGAIEASRVAAGVALRRLQPSLQRPLERPAALAYSAQAHALAGQRDAAIAAADAAIASMPPHRDALWSAPVLWDALLALAWAGERERAMDLLPSLIALPRYTNLSDAVLLHDHELKHLLGTQPGFAAIRAQLLERLRARDAGQAAGRPALPARE